MKLTLTTLALAALLAGCGTYMHSRPVLVNVTVNGDNRTNLAVAAEITKVNVFLQKLSGTKITSAVNDGDYSRRVSVGAFDIVGDAAMIQAISEGVTEGFIKSQTGGMGIHGGMKDAQ